MSEKQKRTLGRPARQNQDRPTDEIILDVAAKLFLERAYQNISMDKIAEAADVTKATVYYYFENKSALYAKSMGHMMARIRKRIRKMISPDCSLEENLQNIAAAHLTATFDLDLDAILEKSKNVLQPKDWDQMTLALRLLEEELEHIFLHAKEQGEMDKSISVSFCTQAFLSLLKIGSKRDLNGEPIYETPETAAEKIVGFFCKGIS